VVILGYRRQRNFERVFFFFCLALFLFYSGSLLVLNAQIHYAAPPVLLHTFALTLLCVGLCFLPPLLVHLHLEYADLRGVLGRGRMWKRLILGAYYSPALFFALRAYPLLAAGRGFDSFLPSDALGRGYGVWLFIACAVSAGWEYRFSAVTRQIAERIFHVIVCLFFVLATVLTYRLHVSGHALSIESGEIAGTVLALLSIIPLAALIYLVQKFNFLQIGRQKNLVYAVSATFLALLYLSLVRRLSGWLEPVLPPEASASILLFLLVIFFEPLQRLLGKSLRETAQNEMDRTQRLASAIQDAARLGSQSKLKGFIERHVKEQLELAEVHLRLSEPQNEETEKEDFRSWTNQFPIQQGNRILGTLWVKPHGAMLSGETSAALEFLCEQLPGALDLCRLIEEKLQLERELAERERLALVGQMAASISHNLKNPLGSIKTILQVQLESPELPDRLRDETKMVLDEISRLSAKLNQLLQFSRPAVRGTNEAAICDLRSVVDNVAGVLRYEADHRGFVLETDIRTNGIKVAASAEALNDILSNLTVNALEATSGHVRIAAENDGGHCVLTVEDDGPGIPEAMKEKILQPFFTTKPQGTGLGLAIVARRVTEFGGLFEWESPIRNGRGARFRVTFPQAGSMKEAG